ncbi:putative alpha-L-glutamate ligase [Halomicronema hongdechloris C2206]|uniref:Alpha-L-glutamate ligase n=1 Tax=Halomicronema hongdechloris C2206 TaxID=1641165 RepID=A0A1Z3HFZ1_9CYAN|nr:RimK/LysX family protein [Halomicronema hongdechloris]ASC69202.1 putative alpha-L-glutamate ligase [Halomicronema hongdechloris C2206]
MPTIGWREWLSLPELGVPGLKAKIDTGARSSALHAFDVEQIERQGIVRVRFKIHPLQRSTTEVITAEADLVDQRTVRSSVGHEQLRPVIHTLVELGEWRWSIELTLTNRDVMGFRMLLGRQAMRQRFLVDPGRSFLHSPHAGPMPK